MNREEALERLNWIFRAADRARVKLSPLGNLPAHGTDLVYWRYYLECLESTAKQNGDPAVGLALGRELRVADLGRHSFILTNAAGSLGEYLELQARHSQISHPVSHYTFSMFKRFGRFYFNPVSSLPFSPVEEDLALAASVQFIRFHLGYKWSPRGVSMRRPKPPDTLQYVEAFGTRTLFERQHSWVEIGINDLLTPINNTDPLLQSVFRAYARDLLDPRTASHGVIVAKVKLLIIEGVFLGSCSNEDVARKLHMSRSTLQRYLERENTSFRKLRAEVLDDLAKQFLSQSREPIYSIAERLGYATTSAFVRAFKMQNSGLSPGGFRKKLGKQM